MNFIRRRRLLNLPSSYDPSALAYFTAAGITNTREKNAWNTFVLGAKTASLWTKFIRIYPISPTSLSAAKYCAKTLLQRVTGGFNNPVHSSTGLTYNGTNQCLFLDGSKSLTTLSGFSDAEWSIAMYVNAFGTPPVPDVLPTYVCGTVIYETAMSPPHTNFGPVSLARNDAWYGNPQVDSLLGAVTGGVGMASIRFALVEIEGGTSSLDFNGIPGDVNLLGSDILPVQPFMFGAAAGVFFDPETKSDVYGLYRGLQFTEAFCVLASPHLTDSDVLKLYELVQAYQTNVVSGGRQV